MVSTYMLFLGLLFKITCIYMCDSGREGEKKVYFKKLEFILLTIALNC